MSEDIDFSQYRRKQQIQPDNEEIDFSKYIRKSTEQIAPKKNELSKFLLGEKERTPHAHANRLAQQLGVSTLENLLLPYEIATIPQGSKEAQAQAYRDTIFEDINRLQEQKEMGIWDEQDQKLYDHLVEQIKNPEKAEQYVQTANIGIRHGLEKLTGADLHPQGTLEKAANWIGYLKNPSNLKSLIPFPIKITDIAKALMPGEKALRALSAGAALQLAEEGQLGPLGSVAAAVAGDFTAMGPKALLSIAKNPKLYAAKVTNFLTGANSKNKWIKQFIDDAKKSGIQLDAGTLTGSSLIKMLQTRAAQSGLTGPALENFRKEGTAQFMREYGDILKDLGELSFENTTQAAESIKSALKVEEENIFGKKVSSEKPPPSLSLKGRISTEPVIEIEKDFLNTIAPKEIENTGKGGQLLKKTAEEIKAPIKKEFENEWTQFNEKVKALDVTPQIELAEDLKHFTEEHRGSLLLGESSPEARVVNAAKRLERKLVTKEGGYIGIKLNDLMKTKRTLGDVANWEFGGSNFESAYKYLTRKVDDAIERTLANTNEELLLNYQDLNQRYSDYKNLFENKNVISLFEPKNRNYNSLYNQYTKNPDKLRALEAILGQSAQGEQLLNQIKRDYAKKVISKPSVTDREIRDLANAIGEQFQPALDHFAKELDRLKKHPLPKAMPQKKLGVNIPLKGSQLPQPKKFKAIEEPKTLRKKMYNAIKDKTSDQIMKMMDTLDGIRKLKRVLSLTPEGRELFKELSRYKLSEMIDRKMKDNVTQQIKLGTFSKLLDTKADKAIAKELLGQENFDRLIRLQSNAGRLNESASKFFNASQSGTVATDVGLVSGVVVGVLTGNPFMALSSLGVIGGMRTIAYLFSDKKFLSYLEEAVIGNKNKMQFIDLLKKMEPHVKKAIIDSKNEQQIDDEVPNI